MTRIDPNDAPPSGGSTISSAHSPGYAAQDVGAAISRRGRRLVGHCNGNASLRDSWIELEAVESPVGEPFLDPFGNVTPSLLVNSCQESFDLVTEPGLVKVLDSDD